ncbi:hypothetical protein GCM10011594_22210 [Nakamurella endophytica]|uniref:Uncharacterized protein n=1 Tax=Nakamurella endophytica TaxID=1748367 RepID=A0A917SWV4_9ACTN|nr:hypothetical protein GCM10011594_22210 [Nakamurella endophytica]
MVTCFLSSVPGPGRWAGGAGTAAARAPADRRVPVGTAPRTVAGGRPGVRGDRAPARGIRREDLSIVTSQWTLRHAV